MYKVLKPIRFNKISFEPISSNLWLGRIDYSILKALLHEEISPATCNAMITTALRGKLQNQMLRAETYLATLRKQDLSSFPATRNRRKLSPRDRLRRGGVTHAFSSAACPALRWRWQESLPRVTAPLGVFHSLESSQNSAREIKRETNFPEKIRNVGCTSRGSPNVLEFLKTRKMAFTAFQSSILTLAQVI